MKKYEQTVCKIPIASKDNPDLEIAKKLSEKGKEGFKVITSFLYNEMKNGKHEFLFVIMEKEI